MDTGQSEERVSTEQTSSFAHSMSILVGRDRRRLEDLALWLLEQRDVPVTVDRLVSDCEVMDAAQGALAYRFLVRAGVLHELDAGRGARVVTAGLVGLLISTGCLVGGRDAVPNRDVRLAWTLPKSLKAPVIAEGQRTIVDLVRSVIESAQERLWLVSPFIDDAGVGQLYKETVSAFRRGVSVTIVTHYLQDIASCNSQAAERLHREAAAVKARFRAYSAREGIAANGHANPLLHAKTVIADGRYGYVGTANLTGNGLLNHFEIGFEMHEPQIAGIEMLLQSIVESDLVEVVLGG